MKHSFRRIALPWLALAGSLAAGSHSAAQVNADPGIDLRLSAMRELGVLGRLGTFPDAVNGIALETTICNEGTAEVEWRQPMNPNHPKIAFLVAKVAEGRIVQVSNRSYLKHGFFALNGRACGSCQPSSGNIGEQLGLGCSDTYGIFNNGDSFYLGPPEEVDPWLGTWERACSHFDRGFPDVGAPDNCDGRRSLTHQAAGALGPVHTRVQVHDRDLLADGTLCYQGMYVVEGMPEAHRDDSLGSRTFGASWDGSRWTLSPTSALLEGTVLQRWPGATIHSSTNGNDDGRAYVAVKVSGPVEGFYRYEYALHNRDNAGGIDAFRIPLCSSARVRNAGFRDIDQDDTNDWTHGARENEYVFASRGEPQPWNTIFNFWFESDAAPGEVAATLGQARPGSAQPSFAVASLAPATLYALHLGPGCALDTPPTLYALGAPVIGGAGGDAFAVASSGNLPGRPNVLYFGLREGARTFEGCNLWITDQPPTLASTAVSDSSGVATHSLPIPNVLALEGKAVRLQALGLDPGNGPLFSDFELSEGLLIRLGSSIPCLH